MKRLVVRRHVIDAKALRLTAPRAEHFDKVVDAPTRVYEGDLLRVVYLQPNFPIDEVLRAVMSIRYNRAPRTGGLMSQSRVFGFSPRVALRRDYCSVSGLARDNAQAHEVICGLAPRLSSLYQLHGGDVYEYHSRLVTDNVRPEWCLEDSVYTSGIINWNNALRYHLDSGNFSDCWSGMLVLPSRVQGGELVMPEFRLAFAFKQPAIIFFDGQSLLHGVTQIQAPKMGYRYSLVYYAMKSMWKCLPVSEELMRIREVKSERERRRLLYGKGDITPKDMEKRAKR